jgi:hypothetical protein
LIPKQETVLVVPGFQDNTPVLVQWADERDKLERPSLVFMHYGASSTAITLVKAITPPFAAP